ncbi:unnamed protein product [Allacma fusca]|uniref:Uncharacterized protein n=1 Tax=Allacma fusca TaxID=39272 RepID=A0A8J2P5X1_9HEXA|nr:unnamed protein product [Allacma fusca]
MLGHRITMAINNTKYVNKIRTCKPTMGKQGNAGEGSIYPMKLWRWLQLEESVHNRLLGNLFAFRVKKENGFNLP